MSWIKRFLPGLESYRGRYAYFALITSLLLMTIALLGWVYVEHNSHRQIAQIEARVRTASALADALQQLNRVENGLQKLIIETTPETLERVEQGLKRLEMALQKLQRMVVGQPSHNRQMTQALLKDMDRLVAASRNLIELRRDVVRWFPALQVMRSEMFPHNQQMLSLLELLLVDNGEDMPIQERLRFLQTVNALRWSWLNMVSEFRLYIANRFGIFASELRDGMKARLTNIRYYAETIPEHLQTLRSMADEGILGIAGGALLTQMESHHRIWKRAFEGLSKSLDEPHWRTDLRLMSDTLNPLLARMHQRITSLDLELDTQSAQDITLLTKIAKRLSASILAISIAGILLILLVYLFLHRYLLQPISQTALALKQEAQGLLDVDPPPAHLKETRDLVDAFTEMRRQVHSRQRNLDHLAHHDALTQLPNRSLFFDRLKHALDIARRGNTQIGLMFLDLDGFKQVNDTWGHLAGDELLKIIADRLRRLVRASDTLGRLGGDEFAVLIEGIGSKNDLTPLAEKTLSELGRPVRIAEQTLQVSGSIGIALLAPHDDITPEQLISDADTAMYASKRAGGSTYRFFDANMEYRVAQSISLENDIRKGIERQEFVYYYQAIVDLQDKHLHCCEALLRWRHPEKGLISPELFLDTLDASGLITRVMDDLLDQAEAHQRAMSERLGRVVAISINLSVRLLNDPAFCRGVLKRLRDGQFANGGLILEITEDILTRELAEAGVFLQQVKTLGGRIALDDFGTAQASLSHLRMFPFDLLKIDQGFIHSAFADTNYASVVDAIINLSHAFSIPVVAEGIETPAQRSFVQQLGCDCVQGHLFGLPMEAERFLRSIQRYAQQASLDQAT